DQAWLSKGLDELVDIAVRYSESGTPVTLVAAPAGAEKVRLAVTDAGPGIDTSRLGELLGDFSQADASETRRVGGFGLGLGFVTRVAERFNLQLAIETHPGKGSEFALLVPTADSVGS